MINRPVTPSMLYRGQSGKCFHCGISMHPLAHTSGDKHDKGWTREHFIPKSKLQFKPKHNIILAHSSCNANRSNRYPTKREVKRFKEVYETIALTYGTTINKN